MRRLARLTRNPVSRRVALRAEVVEHFDAKLDEFADGARENVRMLDLLEGELRTLEEEVFALVEAALEEEPGPAPRGGAG